MQWQRGALFDVTPLDALQIYALKTAPAFEAALFAGLRLAGPIAKYEEPIATFARHLGVGFQILNDLNDWRGDDNNKLLAGQDALAFRPTVLLAMAVQAVPEDRRNELRALLEGDVPPVLRIARLRRLFEEFAIFEKADALVEKSRARAEAVADEIEPETLRRLLYFLVDTVLASREEPQPNVTSLVPLPIAVG
jgi:geranylgeranyl pyrophosphate synthase